MPIQTISDNLALIAGILTSIGILAVSWRCIWRAAKSIMCFITAPRRLENKVDDLAGRFDRFLDSYETDKRTLNSIKKAIYNGGSDGILQNTELSAAFSSSVFESAPYPMFICDSVGGNLRVNRAYRCLVEVWRDDDIQGDQWQSVICGPLKDSYIAGWMRCNPKGEEFWGDVGFRNPANNNFRGTWKIHAPATPRANGSFLYVGTFTTALDEVAAQIAAENQWRVASSIS